MKKKKLLAKLVAAALSIGLGVSSMASVGAMLPSGKNFMMNNMNMQRNFNGMPGNFPPFGFGNMNMMNMMNMMNIQRNMNMMNMMNIQRNMNMMNMMNMQRNMNMMNMMNMQRNMNMMNMQRNMNMMNMQRNFNSVPNNLGNMRQFNNNNIVAPAPMNQNRINPVNNEQKKKLKERFEKLSAGNQRISGPCWLYATTTAINEYRDRTKSGPIIKRQYDDEREYGPVELEYTRKDFDNPLSINNGGPNGKTTEDILNYARSQGLEARQVDIYKHSDFGFSKNELVKFAAEILREHFNKYTSPVLVEAPWGSEFHELAIAGIVGNEILVVNSIGDEVKWHPIEKLADYCKLECFFSFVFFGGAENQNSEHETINFAAFQDQEKLKKAKENLLKFARGDFNIKSLL